ncbi:MAG: cytochrome c oxidase subunit II [Novosphingobium sp.]|nr:cytochrome c oxidase subunit II [Novosphingobium sp.]
MALAAAAPAAPVAAATPAGASQADAVAPNAADENAPAATAAEGSTAVAAPAGEGYTPLGPEWIRGQPVAGAFGFQPQYSVLGEQALWMHNWVLMPIITAICILVLGLLLWVVVRYNRRANPVPSKTSHNTLIEVIWTLVPVIILGIIAFPSIRLLSDQFASPPKDALTIKATGYQWYWGYTYPDNGDFEVISNMLPEEEAEKRGEPGHLAADNRMVVPIGEPLRIQVIGADVIHAFGIPSLWFKIDAVPGRINEKTLTIEKQGIYYGQCMELCGARHGYMPIAIEAVPRPQFEAWVRSKGGTLPGDAAAAAPAGAPPAVPVQAPASAAEGAPAAEPAATAAAATPAA